MIFICVIISNSGENAGTPKKYLSYDYINLVIFNDISFLHKFTYIRNSTRAAFFWEKTNPVYRSYQQPMSNHPTSPEYFNKRVLQS